jgi:hypothetical protein
MDIFYHIVTLTAKVVAKMRAGNGYNRGMSTNAGERQMRPGSLGRHLEVSAAPLCLYPAVPAAKARAGRGTAPPEFHFAAMSHLRRIPPRHSQDSSPAARRFAARPRCCHTISMMLLLSLAPFYRRKRKGSAAVCREASLSLFMITELSQQNCLFNYERGSSSMPCSLSCSR